MSEIKLLRLDFRLIHGQVVLKWTNQVNANRIVIINDEIAQDSFVGSIYQMAAPKKVEVDIWGVEEAAQYWNDNGFGDGRILLLFKDVNTIFELFKLGLSFKEIQIGGLGGGPEKKTVNKAIAFDDDEISKLSELADAGASIYLQITPEDNRMSFKKTVSKFKK